VYLVWGDNRLVSAQIYFSKSTDEGNTWSPNTIISQNIDTLVCTGSHISLDVLGNIYVAYMTAHNNLTDWDIYFTKSTNGGSSFTPPIIVNDSSEIYHQKYCAIAVDSAGQNVYVVWQDWRNLQYEPDIYFSRSTDGGVTFLPGVRVNDDIDTTNQWFPVIACDNSGQNVYVAWMDNRDTLHGWDVYFSRSTDYGQTFEANYPINDTITTGSTPQDYPSVYYKDGIIYAVWHDGRDPSGGYFAKSIDNGVSFGPNILVTDDPWATGYYSSITVDDSTNVYIVWRDYRNYDPYGHEIYFAFSDDSGQTFNPNVLVNDHEGVVSAWDWNPSVCVNDSGEVFVAWSSTRNDPSLTNFDIYSGAGTYVGIQEFLDPTPAIAVQCYPNPFSKLINISFGIGQAASGGVDSRQKSVVSMKIYDVSGRLVKTFSRFTPDALRPTLITWHGDDENGRAVSDGVYFIRFEDRYSGTVDVRKVLKVR